MVKISESASYKLERKQFARILRNYYNWVSLIEAEGGPHTITLPSGQEIHYLDILEGFKILPYRQRQAVLLMCIQDKSEADVAEQMGFKKWPTPVQQYKNYGLARLIAYQKASLEDRQLMLEKGKKYKKVIPSG